MVSLAPGRFEYEGLKKGGCMSRSSSADNLRQKMQLIGETRSQLREQLLHLSPSAFEQLIARLLEACGYGRVQLLSASSGELPQSLGFARRAALTGGADLRALSSNGLSRVMTLVQVKQYRTPVSRRFVDELRGAMLRTGAQQGLLLTTSSFYGPAYTAVHGEGAEGIAPVRLVDGEELLNLLLKHRLGVQEDDSVHPQVDFDLFERLERDFGVRTRGSCDDLTLAKRETIKAVSSSSDCPWCFKARVPVFGTELIPQSKQEDPFKARGRWSIFSWLWQ